LLAFAFGGRSGPGVPRWRSRLLPRGFPPFGRLPPRSKLATSCCKAHCRLVLAFHDDEGSRGTGCGQRWCPGRGETAPLLPGEQAAEHTAPGCRKPRLEEEAVTALKVLARKHPTRGACSPFEGDQAGRLTLLALLQAQQGRPRKLTVAPLCRHKEEGLLLGGI